MEYLKEANKNLISLRTSLIAVVALLTGGLVGMIYSDIDLCYKILPILLGFYIDSIFISNIITINNLIYKNIGAMKNGY